jgi:SagB-type dehydrogenase family enzyme
MKNFFKYLLLMIAVAGIVTVIGVSRMSSKVLDLPEPRFESEMSVEEALKNRRSVRSYKQEALTMEEVSQILWAAQGITAQNRFRTAPSAGATYPLDVYLVAGRVDGLDPGVYKYIPSGHKIELIDKGDKRSALTRASLNQSSVANAPASFVITGTYGRTTGRYGERGVLYTHIEVGHAAQNIYLQCESMGLGTVYIGAFTPDTVAEIITARKNEIPFAVFPVGRK